MHKSILVHVDETASSAHRIDVAARLAIEQSAHPVGTATTGISPYVFPVGGFEPGHPAVTFAIEQLQVAADSALDKFEAAVRLVGVSKLERRRIDEEAGLGSSMQARYADLVVLSQAVSGDSLLRMRSDIPEYVLLNCARPVPVVPTAEMQGEFGKRIAVAWNGSANAVRAITSAIPILRRADHINLVVFNAEMEGDLHGEEPGADMALYLARHDVRVEVIATETDSDPGEALLSYAADSEADLIVMGAYGHSGSVKYFLAVQPAPCCAPRHCRFGWPIEEGGLDGSWVLRFRI